MLGWILIWMLGWGTPDAARAADFPPGVVTLDQNVLDEASGLARSWRHPGHYWALNDSGGAAALFRFDPHGRVRQRLDLPGIQNIDWESLHSFERDGVAWLLIADVGDNRARRREVQLHLLPERAEGEVAQVKTLRLRYEDGPRDVEAVAWDPWTNEALLLSKRDQPARLYSVPLDVSAKLAEARLRAELSLPPPTAQDLREDPRYGRYRSQPTGMDISRDGRRLLVQTYKHAYLFERARGEDWPDVLARSPRVIEMPVLPQTEGASFSHDESEVLTIGEQLPTRLLRTPLMARPDAAR